MLIYLTSITYPLIPEKMNLTQMALRRYDLFMNRWPTLSLCLLCTTLYASPYSMQDLKILAQAKEVKEFFAHAKDILPSKRDSEWKELVRRMGLEWAQRLESAQPDENNFLKLEDLNKWPTLRNDEIFQNQRAKVGLLYFQKCSTLKNEQTCLTLMKKFYRASSFLPELGPMLGRIAVNYHNSSSDTDALYFYQDILASNLSEFYCDKEYIQRPLVKHFYQLSMQLKMPALEKRIDGLVNQQCWDKLIPFFNRELEGDNIDHAYASFKVLQAKNSLNKLSKAAYYLATILGKHYSGEHFKMAWSWLVELKKDYKTRDVLLNRMRNKKHLPGRLFSDNNKRARVLIKALKENFPEYLDYYASQCLKYLAGLEKFPLGNPTVECHQLFKTAKQDHLFPDLVIKRYDKLTTF